MSSPNSASHPEQIKSHTRSATPFHSNAGLVIERSKDVNCLKRALLTPDETRDISRCVLTGTVGSGKTTLVTHLCSDPGIITAFQENILWFNLGNNPTDLVDQINELGTDFSSNWYFEDTIQAALTRLYALFSQKNALIILDGVQTVEQALLFAPPEKNIFILITTRSQRLAKALHAQEVLVHDYSLEEAKHLITSLGIKDALPHLNLNNPSVRLPLVMHLLCTCIKHGISFEHIDLSDESLSSLDLIAQLWDTLLTEHLAGYQEAVKALAIFPALTPLSYPIITQYWHSILEDTVSDTTEALFEALQHLHILDHRAHSNTASLSDLFVRYVDEYTSFDIQDHHRQFLDLYPVDYVLANATSIDEYIYRFLTYHLDAANRTDTLFQLLLSARWITAKIQQTNPATLQEDYRFERADRTVRIIDEAIRLSSKILTLDKSQIVIQLISRLQKLDINAIGQLTDSLRAYRATEKTWLDPGSVNLKMPSSALLSIYQGHHAAIVSTDIHARHLLTASEDHTVRLWDLSNGNASHPLQDMADEAHLVQFSPDGNMAVAASDTRIYIWEVESRTLSRVLSFHTARILSILVLPDNQSVLSADESGRVYKTDLTTGNQSYYFVPEHDQTWAMAVTPQQVLAFTAGNSSTIHVWDAERGTHKHALIAHEDWVWDLAITRNGRYLLSASEDQTILVWDLFAGRVIRVLKGHRAGVRRVSLAEDDTVVISSDEEQSIIVWDFNSGKILRSFTGLTSWIHDMKPHPDGKGIFLASDEPELKLWSITDTLHSEVNESHEKGVRGLVLSPGNIHLISASDDATIRKWHVQTGELVQAFQGHQDWISDLSVSRSGAMLVSSSFDHTLRVWDTESGTEIRSLTGHTDWVWRVAISSNSTHIASGSEDCTIRVWDPTTGGLLHTLEGHERGVTQLLFSIDNKFLISSSLDHTIRVWHVEKGTLAHVLEGHTATIHHLILSPPGQRIISASDDGSIRLWNFELGHADEHLTNEGGAVHRIHMLSDGYRLLSISEDMALRVWDLVTSTPMYTLFGHTARISDLAVSTNNRFAATAGSDGKLCLWDLEFGHLTDSFYADYPLTCCTFTSDNERLIGADAGGGIHFLDIRQQDGQTDWW